jgi:FAD/FMN-containing dehydrogenase
LSAFEAMWSSYFHYVLDHSSSLESPFDERFALYALVEIEGTSHDGDRAELEAALVAALGAGTIADAALAQSERETKTFWAIRDAIGDITPTLQPLLAFDVSLELGSMKAFLATLDAEFSRFPDPVTNLVFGHIGDSNLHLAVTTHSARDLERLCEIVYGTVGAHGGSISAEHGVGTLRRDYLRHSRTAAEIELMRRLKRALDPNGILNADRVLPA